MINGIGFTIPGEPVAWARAGGRGPIRFTPSKQRHFGALVKQIASSSLPADWKLIDEPAELFIRCVFARPKSKCRRRDNPDQRDWNPNRKDADNCAKIVSDNLNGIVWTDDRVVARLVVEKWMGKQGEPPFVEVRVGRVSSQFPLRAVAGEEA